MDDESRTKRIRVPWLVVGTIAGPLGAILYQAATTNPLRRVHSEAWHWPEYMIAGTVAGFVAGLLLDSVIMLARTTHRRKRCDSDRI
jgi:hypothetical protein